MALPTDRQKQTRGLLATKHCQVSIKSRWRIGFQPTTTLPLTDVRAPRRYFNPAAIRAQSALPSHTCPRCTEAGPVHGVVPRGITYKLRQYRRTTQSATHHSEVRPLYTQCAVTGSYYGRDPSTGGNTLHSSHDEYGKTTNCPKYERLPIVFRSGLVNSLFPEFEGMASRAVTQPRPLATATCSSGSNFSIPSQGW
ncbi:hypothetical protein Bbelb_396020 [Branchiostoma belcheri]|nr:hypothetical protein Bbelb_396020 [Branchiostoma belcheri]